VSVNGGPIKDSKELARKIAELKPTLHVQIGIIRDGRSQTIEVTLGKFPSTSELASARPDTDRPSSSSRTVELPQLGLTVGPTDDGSAGAAIVDVENGSDASDKGLRSGDIILEVGGMTVHSTRDVSEGVKKMKDLGRRAIFLRVKSGSQIRFVAVRLKGA
jgi:serine protease Do